MQGRPRLLVARFLGVVMACEVVVFTVSTLPGVRTSAGFVGWLDGWLQGCLYVTVAAFAYVRPISSAVDRVLWTAVAAALTARALGFVAQLGVIRTLQPTPYPSIADAGWLLTYPLLIAGLVSLAGTAFRRLSTNLVLDGVTGALAVGSVAYAVLADALQTLARPHDTAVVLVNLAYPLLDVLVLVVVLGVFLGYRNAPPASLCGLGVGIVGFAVVDGVYVYQAAAGTFTAGGALQALSAATTALMAVAGQLPDRPRAPTGGIVLTHLALPTLFAVAALAVLVFSGSGRVPALSVALAAAALITAVVRTHLSYRLLRHSAEHRRQAHTDELTGLANRRLFNESMSRALDGRPDDRPMAVLIVDLNDFKAVNDNFGHHHGDDLLVQIAYRLRHSLRDDDLVARIGGDEFAVLMDGATAELAVEVAQRLQIGIRAPFHIAAREVRVGASVGIALFPNDGRDAGELFQHADIAMYNAKVNRTGQSLFTPAQYRTSRTRLDTTERLRAAIVSAEMVPWFQPVVELGPDAMVSAEALVRWQQPGGTVALPATFLAQVESAGLMTLLTADILDRSLAWIAGWRASGQVQKVAVNISVTTLLDPEFPTQVAELLRRHQLPGAALDLELTEDLLMADPSRARNVIDALVSLGVGIIIDDYGTGYSNLGYLRDPIGIRGLKLDRSFITGLDNNHRARAIVASTLALARALDLTMVAEGVETAAERNVLVDLGCRLAQGYHFARPMSAADFESAQLETPSTPLTLRSDTPTR
jgi:diguanylate cyclase (GGDEF)-like protein